MEVVFGKLELLACMPLCLLEDVAQEGPLHCGRPCHLHELRPSAEVMPSPIGNEFPILKPFTHTSEGGSHFQETQLANDSEPKGAMRLALQELSFSA